MQWPKQGALLLTVSLGWTLLHVASATAQPSLNDALVNGGMEEIQNDRPKGWIFNSSAGGKLKLDNEDPREGDTSALIDVTEPKEGAPRLFTNLSQLLDAKPYQGKRLRYRAAVRTAELDAETRVQLWFRVDRSGNDPRSRVGAFDNMQDRPIRSSEWKHFEIVLDINDDAEQMIIGMFVIGTGKAWLDDVTLEEVDEDTPTTDMELGSGGGSGSSRSQSSRSQSSSSRRSNRRQMSPILMKAMAEAEDAPQQPFFTPWLWLAVIAMTLFAISGWPPKTIHIQQGMLLEHKQILGPLPKFAVRFSCAYWLLYSFPAPLTSFVRTTHTVIAAAFPNSTESIGKMFDHVYNAQAKYQEGVSKAVHWFAENHLKITGELVPPNGSGDTTFSYVKVLMVFLLALAIATVWSMIDWRKTDYSWIKDLLRSYLRYVLGLTMLGYGLAKVAWDSNQFPLISEGQLAKTWGDSSPMNVVWSFMGASRPYTVFSGLGEVVGGVLLIFRRTTVLGAMVTLGVMINVMMLNYCYDVPVKLYSTHLVCMALYILLPEAQRLGSVLLLNRPTEPVDMRPPYTNPYSIWVQRTVKVCFIVLGFGIPIGMHAKRQYDYFSSKGDQPAFFGVLEVVEFKRNGEVVSADGESTRWKTVKFQNLNYNMQGERGSYQWMSATLPGRGSAAVTFELEDDGETLNFSEHQNAILPQGSATLVEADDGQFQLVGKSLAGDLEITLKPSVGGTSRLTRRGYRWINEVPFNR